MDRITPIGNITGDVRYRLGVSASIRRPERADAGPAGSRLPTLFRSSRSLETRRCDRP
jgi:hypothetical protein